MEAHSLSSAGALTRPDCTRGSRNAHELMDVLEAFTPDERLMIGATTRWSAKDVLAHLVPWEVAALDDHAG
jgi:hypothetical protein